MRLRIANEIPVSAQTLWETSHTPEFCAFLAREYGLIQREMDRGDSWRIESPVLKDRIYCSGTLRLTPIDAECCVRTMEGEIIVTLVTVGWTLEKSICKEIKNTAQNLAEIVTKWKALNVKGCNSRTASHNSYQGTCI